MSLNTPIQFFSTVIPKPKDYHFYFNAFKTWHRLGLDVTILSQPDPEFEESLAQYQIKWFEEPELDLEYKLPCLNRLIHAYRQLCTAEYICILNSDIMLSPAFLETFAFLRSRYKQFFMVGQRWDWYHSVAIDEEESFESWFSLKNKDGRWHQKTGIDYFVFPVALLDQFQVPAFLVPRGGRWDHWLAGMACKKGIPLVDTTATNMILHMEPSPMVRNEIEQNSLEASKHNDRLYWDNGHGCDISGASHKTYRNAQNKIKIQRLIFRLKGLRRLTFKGYVYHVFHRLFGLHK